MRTTDLAEHLSKYLTNYLPHQKGLSKNSTSSYTTSIIMFLKFLESYKGLNVEKLRIKDITRDLILDFLEHLQIVRKCGNATRNLRLSALKSFFRYLKYNNIQNFHETQKILSIDKKKTRRDFFSYLSTGAIKSILEQPDTNTKKGIRDLALLSLMYDTAGRVSEIINLTPSMIRMEKPHIIRILGKGNKTRVVPLIDAQIIHLKNYLDIFELNNPVNQLQPLFFNSRKEKLTRSGVSYILAKYVNKAIKTNRTAFPKKVSCHTLRHSKAMHMLQAGVELIYIRDILGHVSIETTQIYARADTKQKRIALEKAYENLSPEKPIWEGNKGLIDWLKKF